MYNEKNITFRSCEKFLEKSLIFQGIFVQNPDKKNTLKIF